MEAATSEGRSATESERPVSGFEINGEPYAIPKLHTINLDEERILYLYADTVLQDFAPAHPTASEDERRAYEAGQARKIRNPDFKRALAHIAYRREHPDVSDSEIQAAIGLVNALEVDIAILRGDDEDPPLSSPSSSSSESDESEQSEAPSSGGSTESTSETQEKIRLVTGTSESDTSSTSPQATVALGS